MANQPLFRHAALNAQKNNWLGTILIIRPTSYFFLTALAVVCAALVVAFFTWGTYTKRSTVIGQLVPESGLVKVYAPQFGIVVEKKVNEGQLVNQGDVLFTISSERYSNERGSIQASISAQHIEQRNSLQNEIIKTRKQQYEEQQALTSRIDGLKDELSSLDTQYESQQTRVRLSDEAYKRYQDLMAQNYTSKEQSQQKQEEWLEQSSRLESIAREQVRMKRELAARKDDLSSLRIKHLNDIAQIERTISNVKQQLTESEAKRRLTIRAPATGTATAAIVNVGNTIDGSHPLVSIVPLGTQLQAQLFAQSRSVGFVREGALVRMRYQAFPYQKFGQATGKVLSVSRTALAAGEIFTMGNPTNNNQNSESLYRITVALDKQFILAYGAKQPLQAGMLLDADIMQETRHLYEWVLEPLFSLTGKI